MTLAKRCEDDLLKAPTVVGVRKHPDLIHNECLVYAGDIAARVQTIIMTVCRDVVYSDDETYGQKQVPVDTTDNNKHQKDNQLAGNSSPRVHACLQAVMPAAILKGGMEEVVFGGAHSNISRIGSRLMFWYRLRLALRL